MKLPIITGVALALAAMTATAQALDLKSKNDRLSYTIGVDLGKNFKRQKIALNHQALSQGLHDIQGDKHIQLTETEMKSTLKMFNKELLDKRVSEFKRDADANKELGEKFLAENKNKPGVKVTASGLQYKELSAGQGAAPTATDMVEVEYTGTLLNGKVFDTTDGRGKPVSFKLNEVIPGWTEALQLMKEGATWEIYIPAELAYGARGVGAGGPIGPNEALIFKIKLLKIKK
jgi:FKBP-type peptidyl-prolyl cis-trans isomerase FklB